MICIAGSGKWGSALAHALSGGEQELKIYSYRKRAGFASESELHSASHLVFALSSQTSAEFLAANFAKNNTHQKVLIATKGMHEGRFMSEVFAPYFKHIAVLSGPSFAAEVMQDLPTAVVVASRDEELASEFCSLFKGFIRPYTSSDLAGAELAGVYKNIIAIAAAISDSLGFGNNARAALLARALVEMARFGEHLGARAETFFGLCGAGDLFLTASSSLSRNYRAGELLAQGKSAAQAAAELGEVAEGLHAARQICKIAKEKHIYLPIASQIAELLEGKNLKDAITDLLRR